jgi:hypothetical protein
MSSFNDFFEVKKRIKSFFCILGVLIDEYKDGYSDIYLYLVVKRFEFNYEMS